MNQKRDYPDPAQAEISMEDFDAWQEDHVFSEKYQRNKKKMLREYRHGFRTPGAGKWAKVPAAAVFVALASGTMALAANSEFFYRIWGTHGKENIETHEEILCDERTGSQTVVVYPEREYTDENLDRAGELIGDPVFPEPVVKQIGDTRLTILSAVRDGNAAVVEFTLEREEGVDGLGIQYGQFDNESKGAWFTEESPFTFDFREGSGSIFVDLERSSETALYCYDYMVTDSQAIQESLTLEIYHNTPEETREEAETVQIPVPSRVRQREFENGQGGTLLLSPISVQIDMNGVPGLTREQAGDPWYVYYVALHDRDGSSYMVHEHEIEGLHSCGTYVDNSSYAREDQENRLTFVFNRLVDDAQVESVTVNETRYRTK